MRLTILAGLITGASLAIQVALSAHVKLKAVPPNSAIQIRVVAPWYIASNTPYLSERSQDSSNHSQHAQPS